GVLQRIAVCYLVAALLFLTTGWRTQAIVTAALLLGYWGAMTLVPVPGYGRGNLGPEGNLAAWLDRAVLGPHIWRAARVYDPEGILSTVPAVATTLLGVLVGRPLRRPRRQRAGALLPLHAGGPRADADPRRQHHAAHADLRARVRAVGLADQRVARVRGGVRARVVGRDVAALPRRRPPARV